MDIKITCPLGHNCEKVVDGHIERCRWYINVQGKHPQKEEVIDQWDCAIAWQPLMQIETSRTNRGVQAATESFRNEMVKSSTQLNDIIQVGVDNAQKKLQ